MVPLCVSEFVIDDRRGVEGGISHVLRHAF